MPTTKSWLRNFSTLLARQREERNGEHHIDSEIDAEQWETPEDDQDWRSFKFRPLESADSSIRLLTLLPGRGGEPVSCSMHHFPRSESPQYSTVSYTWGPPQPPRWIKLDGNWFQVRRNIYDFLRRLREPDRHYILWVDAICIDQSNDMEKSAQVRMMGDIYKTAFHVLVWLGKRGDDIDCIMEYISKPQRKVAMDASCWKALAKLCECPYWSRTWIIQEIGLARGEVILHCGSKKAPYSQFLGLCGQKWLFEQLPGREQRVLQAAFKTTRALNATFQPTRPLPERLESDDLMLERLLERHQDSACFDPRDKVYALLSIAGECRLQADYTKTTATLFMDVLRVCYWGRGEGLLEFANLLKESLSLSTEDIRAEIRATLDRCSEKDSFGNDEWLRRRYWHDIRLELVGVVAVDASRCGLSELKTTSGSPQYRITLFPNKPDLSRGTICITDLEAKSLDRIFVIEDTTAAFILRRAEEDYVIVGRALIEETESADAEPRSSQQAFDMIRSGAFEGITARSYPPAVEPLHVYLSAWAIVELMMEGVELDL